MEIPIGNAAGLTSVNDLWRGRTPERFYDALEWLYGWNASNCLADH